MTVRIGKGRAGAIIASFMLLLSFFILLGTERSPGVLSPKELGSRSVIIGFFLLLVSFFVMPHLNECSESKPSITLSKIPRVYFGLFGVLLLGVLIYSPEDTNFIPFCLWLSGSVGFVALAIKGFWTDSSKVRISELATICGILIIAAAQRFYAIGEIPYIIDGDVFSVGLDVRRIYSGEEPRWIGPGWGNMSIQYMLFWAGLGKIFGDSLQGLCASFALTGLAGVFAIWLLGRTIGESIIGVLAAFFLATNIFSIHFGRSLYIEPAAVLTVLALTFILVWLRSGKSEHLLISGFITGIGMLAYESVRIIAPIFLVLAVIIFFEKRIKFKTSIKAGALFLIALILAWGPMTRYLAEHYFEISGRAGEVTIFNPVVRTHLYAKYGATSGVELLMDQVARSYGGIFYYYDNSPHTPYIWTLLESPLCTALAALGLIAALRGWTKDPNRILLIWFILVPFFGGVLTNDPPYGPHLVMVIPALTIMMAIGTLRLFEAGKALNLKWIAISLLGAAILLDAGYTWRRYITESTGPVDPYSALRRHIVTVPAGEIVLGLKEVPLEDRRIQYSSRHLHLHNGVVKDIDKATVAIFNRIISRFEDAEAVESHLKGLKVPILTKTQITSYSDAGTYVDFVMK